MQLHCNSFQIAHWQQLFILHICSSNNATRTIRMFQVYNNCCCGFIEKWLISRNFRGFAYVQGTLFTIINSPNCDFYSQPPSCQRCLNLLQLTNSIFLKTCSTFYEFSRIFPNIYENKDLHEFSPLCENL